MTYPDDITPEDLQAIGAHVIAAVGLVDALGHNGPAGLPIYCAAADWRGDLVLDLIRSTTERDARDRLSDFAQRCGVLDRIAEAVAR